MRFFIKLCSLKILESYNVCRDYGWKGILGYIIGPYPSQKRYRMTQCHYPIPLKNSCSCSLAKSKLLVCQQAEIHANILDMKTKQEYTGRSVSMVKTCGEVQQTHTQVLYIFLRTYRCCANRWCSVQGQQSHPTTGYPA